MRIDIPDQAEVIKHYGRANQTMICMEECAELAQAASKALRQSDGSDRKETSDQRKEELTEEIAHVMICIRQMMDMYGIKENEVENYIQEAYGRVRRKIAEAENWHTP